MLTRELIIYRCYKDKIYPYQLTENQDNLDLITNLIKKLKASIGKSRHSILKQIELETAKQPKILKGLVKMLLDQAVFDIPHNEDPMLLRETIFNISAEYWSCDAKLEASLEAHQKKLSLQFEKTFQSNDKLLYQNFYADIPSNQCLVEFNPLTPESLLQQYNLAQIQFLLIYMKQLHLTLSCKKDVAFRQVMQMLKFFGLMFTVTQRKEDYFRLEIDGPASILENAKSYGLEVAKFFPSLFLLKSSWLLESIICLPNKAKNYTLKVESDKLVYSPKKQLQGVWAHHTIVELVEQFNQKYAIQYLASIENNVLTLSKNQYLIPDLKINNQKKEWQIELIRYVTPTKLQWIIDHINEIPNNYLWAIKIKNMNLYTKIKHIMHHFIIFKNNLTASAIYRCINS